MKGKKTGGRVKGTPNKSHEDVREVIDRALGPDGMDKVFEGLIKLAPKNPLAAKLLLEYRYGKPIQKLEHSGNEGGPVEHTVTVTIHHAADAS